MEVRIDVNDVVVEWLASMGYPVKGMPTRLLRGMLLREARQWNVSPEALQALIHEGARTRTATGGDGSPPIQPGPYGRGDGSDRLIGFSH